MSGDYSRIAFDPRRYFSGVLMQQGRVGLDSDWNELVSLVERRLRAETVDIVGRCAVPRETPDGFLIQASGTGAGKSATIGRGRIYVHGLLAENHGAAPFRLDLNTPRPGDLLPEGVLAEVVGGAAHDYASQPFLPLPPPLPVSDGPHLFYLDVWQREVTSLEDERLLEKALNGVDTTTRMQTVWQVRVLPDVGADVDCSSPDADVPGWSEVIRPSGGLLSTDAVEIENPEDPCILPPGSGYSGLENQLYRVEMHDGGPPGTANFKWSRDNATVAASIEVFEANDAITVNRIGRDAILRFNQGDWLEVTDDRRELHGRPGEMRRIVDIREDLRRIVLSSALPADLLPSGASGDTPKARHSRIRRWDQRGEVRDTSGTLLVDLDDDASGGVIPVPAAGTELVLENGVRVTFGVDPDNDRFRALDHWSFAARTADRSVEQLTDAPPQGTHHHYCRLAIATFPEQVKDCRVFWPPEFEGAGCACTVCVTAESHNSGVLTIQTAIDQVVPTGGTVCLEAGEYVLGDSPLVIDSAQAVCLRGQGFRTVLNYSGGGPALSVRDGIGVSVEDLTVLVPAASSVNGRAVGGGPCLLLHNGLDVKIRGCVLALLSARDEAGAAIALEGLLLGLDIQDNAILAPEGMSGADTEEGQGDTRYVLGADVSIRDNVLACRRRGIVLGALSIFIARTCIAANTIIGCEQGGIAVGGVVAESGRIDAEGNTLLVAGPGIALRSDSALIARNEISRFGDDDSGAEASGIVLLGDFLQDFATHCWVRENRILGFPGHGIEIRGSVREATVRDNVIEGTGRSAISMLPDASCGTVVVENNRIENVANGIGAVPESVAVIRLHSGEHVRIEGNTIRRAMLDALRSVYRAGIDVLGCTTATIRDNAISEIGPPEAARETVGIRVQVPFARVQVDSNFVARGQVDAAPSSAWFAVRIVGALRASGEVVDASVLTFVPGKDVYHALGPARIRSFARARLTEATLTSNHVTATGGAEVVDVRDVGSCVFTSNQCLLLPDGNAAFVVAITGAQIAASNNVVRRPSDMDAMLVESKVFTVLGNITFGNIRIGGGAPLPAPWKDLNVLSP